MKGALLQLCSHNIITDGLFEFYCYEDLIPTFEYYKNKYNITSCNGIGLYKYFCSIVETYYTHDNNDKTDRYYISYNFDHFRYLKIKIPKDEIAEHEILKYFHVELDKSDTNV